jgi:hypothetical protein
MMVQIFLLAFTGNALLMSSMFVKRRPFKVFFIFGNKKKTHGAISVEYGGWAMTTVLFLAKKLGMNLE